MACARRSRPRIRPRYGEQASRLGTAGLEKVCKACAGPSGHLPTVTFSPSLCKCLTSITVGINHSGCDVGGLLGLVASAGQETIA